MSERIYSRIAGTGSYLPEKVVTNDDLAKVVDTSDEWIHSRTGIRERRVAADDQTIVCDTNHPLAGLPANLTITVLDVRPKGCETGGSLHVWLEEVLDGPGLETAMADQPMSWRTRHWPARCWCYKNPSPFPACP